MSLHIDTKETQEQRALGSITVIENYEPEKEQDYGDAVDGASGVHFLFLGSKKRTLATGTNCKHLEIRY